jgi:hypothetical protein
MLCLQPSTVHVELPGFLEPGAVPANLVAATARAEGVLTDTNHLREHEHCLVPPGECILLCKVILLLLFGACAYATVWLPVNSSCVLSNYASCLRPQVHVVWS